MKIIQSKASRTNVFNVFLCNAIRLFGSCGVIRTTVYEPVVASRHSDNLGPSPLCRQSRQ